jgi:hypothetical protein
MALNTLVGWFTNLCQHDKYAAAVLFSESADTAHLDMYYTLNAVTTRERRPGEYKRARRAGRSRPAQRGRHVKCRSFSRSLEKDRQQL